MSKIKFLEELQNEITDLKDRINYLERVVVEREESDIDGAYLNQRSTLFFRNLTAIDYAVLNIDGVIRGGSFHLNCSVTGNVEENEQVVVDFGTLKKKIKELIDHKEFGFDHKLWVKPIKEYNQNKSISVEISNDYYNQQEYTFINVKNASTLEIITQFKGPANSVKIVSNVTKDIKVFLEEHLNEIYPDADITVNVDLSEDAFTDGNDNYFRYVHGLKNSTSWGCQNMNHGHLSFIEVYRNGEKCDVDDLFDDFYYRFDNCLFLNRNDVTVYDDNIVMLKYSSPRGDWWSRYNLDYYSNIIYLDKDTTIENIVEYLLQGLHSGHLNNPHVKPGVYTVFVSEGLQKGAQFEYKKDL